MSFFSNLFRANRTSAEVVDILNSILDRSITDEEWDDFISVKIIDPVLEDVRQRMEEIWTEDSPYRLGESFDPTDLNPKGIAEIKKLITVAQRRSAQ